MSKGFLFQQKPQPEVRLPIAKPLYCPNEQCPNIEKLSESDCPECQEKGKEYGWTQLEELRRTKYKNAKLKQRTLFALEVDSSVLVDKLEGMLQEIAKIEGRSSPKDNDDMDITILLLKSILVQEQLNFRQTVLIAEGLRRLLGLE